MVESLETPKKCVVGKSLLKIRRWSFSGSFSCRYFLNSTDALMSDLGVER